MAPILRKATLAAALVLATTDAKVEDHENTSRLVRPGALAASLHSNATAATTTGETKESRTDRREEAQALESVKF